jgi:hypothetical protein
MTFQKLDAFTKKVADLADKPALNASELKAQFDAAPEELRTYFNNLVDALNNQEAFNPAVLENAWLVFGSGDMDPGYMKDQLGFVHIRGHVKDGTTTPGTTIFTLPTGYRPSSALEFNTVSNDGTKDIVARVTVTADGRVVFTTGAYQFFSLNIPPFKAEQ